MQESNRLGENIKSLRKAFGESQEKLGEYIGVEKNTVSYYEQGKRIPPKDTLIAIAHHFMVPVDEMLNSDFTGVEENGNGDLLMVCKNINIFFPMISSEKALRNNDFKKAYSFHKKMYKKIKHISLYDIQSTDAFDNWIYCIEKYTNSCEDESSKDESIANMLALWFIILMVMKNASIIGDKLAWVEQQKRNNHLVEELYDNVENSDFEKDSQELWDEIKESGFDDIKQMFISLKKSNCWSDLGDYYLALQYVYNLVDNDLSAEHNLSVGREMINMFASVGNKYARKFLNYAVSSAEAKSSQSVDDKM